MAYNFKDFVPKEVAPKGLFHAATYDSLENTVIELNTWISSNAQLEIFQIETVVLPNMHSSWEEGSKDTSIKTNSEYINKYHQFFRVWYK